MTSILIVLSILAYFQASMSLLTYAVLTAIDGREIDKEEHLIIILLSIAWPLGLGLIIAQIYDSVRTKPALKVKETLGL